MLEQLVAARLNLASDWAVKGKQNEQKLFLIWLSDQTDQTASLQTCRSLI